VPEGRVLDFEWPTTRFVEKRSLSSEERLLHTHEKRVEKNRLGNSPIRNEPKIHELSGAVFAHPTWAETFHAATLRMCGAGFFLKDLKISYILSTQPILRRQAETGKGKTT
jgi:hypothetical protein